MFFSMPIQWYHSHVDPISPDGIPLTEAKLGNTGIKISYISLFNFIRILHFRY